MFSLPAGLKKKHNVFVDCVQRSDTASCLVVPNQEKPLLQNIISLETANVQHLRLEPTQIPLAAQRGRYFSIHCSEETVGVRQETILLGQETPESVIRSMENCPLV